MHRRTAVLLGFCFLASLARGNLITNGSFETGDFSGWTVTPAATGSSFGVTNAVGPLEGPESGSYYAYFGGEQGSFDAITQTLTTTPGHYYEISYWVTVTSGNNGTNQAFDLIWQGVAEPSFTNLSSTPPTFLFYFNASFAIIATGTSSVFGFQGFDATGDVLLDNVVVTDIGPLVPEPASTALIPLGLAIAAAWSKIRAGCAQRKD